MNACYDSRPIFILIIKNRHLESSYLELAGETDSTSIKYPLKYLNLILKRLSN